MRQGGRAKQQGRLPFQADGPLENREGKRISHFRPQKNFRGSNL